MQLRSDRFNRFRFPRVNRFRFSTAGVAVYMLFPKVSSPPPAVLAVYML